MFSSKSLLNGLLIVVALTGSGHWKQSRAEECGIIDDSESELSENGEEYTPSKAPWAASIYLQTPRRGPKYCGGTLISPFHVLTVGGCVSDYQGEENGTFHVELGRPFYEYGNSSDKGTVQSFVVGKELIQPEYLGRIQSYDDIVIFNLGRAATINKYVRPVCIDNTIGNERDLNGKFGKVVIWKEDEEVKLKETRQIQHMMYKSREECNSFLQSENNRLLPEGKFCDFSKSQINGHAIRSQSGGGGLIFEFEKKHYIYGVMQSSIFIFRPPTLIDIFVLHDIRKEGNLKYINSVIERDTKNFTELAEKGDTYIPSNVPWAAGIYSHIGNDVRRICSGTLISPVHVLTAAICVHYIDDTLRESSTIKVALGQQYLKYNDSRDTQTAQYFDVGEIIIPDTYEGDLRSYSSDIAVLKLSTIVKNTTFVQPVCVGHERELNQNIGKMMYWNSLGDYIRPLNETFKIIDFPYKGYEECKNFLKGIKPGDYLTKDKFCSYSEDGDKIVVPRTVDAGAGLIFVFNDTPCVYGVASKTVRDKMPTFTDIRERKNFDFIKNKANYEGSGHWKQSRAEECGIIDDSESELSRNGEELTPSKAPWAASIYLQTPRGGIQHCGGTLISPFHVLTVGSCVLPFTNDNTYEVYHVELGRPSYEYGNSSDKGTVQSFVVGEELIQPEILKRIQRPTHIAILNLGRAVTINKYVRPVCIDNTIGYERDLNGKIGKIVYWEDDEMDILPKNATIEHIMYKSREECNTYKQTDKRWLLSEDEFCGFSTDGKLTRKLSTIGAGLIFQFEKKHYVYGVLHNGYYYIQVRHTDVSKFADIRKEENLKFINTVIV